MIFVFDLDDTLYDEYQFVLGGFKSVAHWLSTSYGFQEKDIVSRLIYIYNRDGRVHIFNKLLTELSIFTKINLSKCISKYRSHEPQLELYNSAKDLLKLLTNQPYLVTDGNKLVQKSKIIALGLDKTFKKCFVTHNYGLKAAKPSLHCFEKIKLLEKCDYGKIIYVGDNPQKDFVGLNKVGCKTVRFLNGPHKFTKVNPDFDSQYKVKDLLEVAELFSL